MFYSIFLNTTHINFLLHLKTFYRRDIGCYQGDNNLEQLLRSGFGKERDDTRRRLKFWIQLLFTNDKEL